MKNKVEQLEAGNLYPVRISRTVRAQKTRTKLKELLVNRQISLKKYATGQGQLNVVIKDKRARRQDTQADLRGIYFINIADALDIFTNFLNVAQFSGALASVASADGDEEPRRVRGANGGRMRAARGVRGRGAAPRYK